jgi:predicted Zn-dependent protease
MKTLTRAVVLFLALFFAGCSSVPITGRKQLSLIPESEMIAMGFAAYDDFLKENPPSSDKVNSQVVKSVGTSISNAVQLFFAANNMSARLNGYKWDYALVENNVPNAFCLPGGKVVIYSGILPLTADRNGLAVVISHEIAHAVARHGNERMSQQLLVQFGAIALNEAVQKKPEETQQLFYLAYGAGSQLGVLAYSREHEYEADKLGLVFMALAGYDPSTAVDFWQRMSKVGGSRPPEFLSTHPTDENRIKKIKEALPEVMQYYKKQ